MKNIQYMDTALKQYLMYQPPESHRVILGVLGQSISIHLFGFISLEYTPANTPF